MALFDWFGTPKDSGPPARNDRQKCWESRDAYYACLDKVNVLIPGKEENKCAAQLKAYEGNCAKSWVRGFLYSSIQDTGPTIGFIY